MNKRNFSIKLSLLCLLSIASISSHAELQVIADLGGESAVRFYESIQPVHSDTAPVHPNAIPSTVSEAQMLPVVSHKWRVGKVVSQSVNLPGALPLFLIGADDTSMNWLHAKRDQLRAMSAMGLVINVQTIKQLEQLRAIAPDLELMPAPADSLSDRLGISHYPLLITAEGFSQ